MKNKIVAFLFIKKILSKFQIFRILTIVFTLIEFYLLYKFYKNIITQNTLMYLSVANFITFVYLYFKISKLIPLNKNQIQNLMGIGFGDTELEEKFEGDKRIIKKKNLLPYFAETEDYIELGTPKTSMTLDEVTEKLQSLSNILKVDLLEVTSSRHSLHQIIFRIEKDNFSKIEVKNFCDKFYYLNAGSNSKKEKIELDLKKDFSIFIGGTSGSGKTQLILEYISQLYNNLSGVLDIIIIDDKGVDYKQLVENYGAKYYDSSSLEDLEKFNLELIRILAQKNETKKILAEHASNHAEELREKNIELPLRRTLILCDEAGAYLRVKSEAREDYKEIKKEIVANLTICLSQLRAFGCPIVVATQRVTKDEIDVPYDNFQVRLFNGIAIEMSRKYCNGLVSEKANKGKWYISSEKFSGFLKTPFTANIKNTFRKITKNHFQNENEITKNNFVEEIEQIFKLRFPESLIQSHPEILKNLAPEEKEKLRSQLHAEDLITFEKFLSEKKENTTFAAQTSGSRSEREGEQGQALAACRSESETNVLRIEREPSRKYENKEFIKIFRDSILVKEFLTEKNKTDEELLKRVA